MESKDHSGKVSEIRNIWAASIQIQRLHMVTAHMLTEHMCCLDVDSRSRTLASLYHHPMPCRDDHECVLIHRELCFLTPFSINQLLWLWTLKDLKFQLSSLRAVTS
uniref:Uncharacterized protein n=1 Tax=Spermophilus dauricus TaxID=99837 RepID=A0A8C9QL77_SPEDA